MTDETKHKLVRIAYNNPEIQKPLLSAIQKHFPDLCSRVQQTSPSMSNTSTSTDTTSKESSVVSGVSEDVLDEHIQLKSLVKYAKGQDDAVDAISREARALIDTFIRRRSS